MSDLVYKYPLDLTADNPQNLVPGELHTMQPGINRSVVPRYGAYYTESLIVYDQSTGQPLEKNDQYVPIMYWEEPSERSGKEVCCGIVVTDQTVSDDIYIDYQVVGGLYINIAPIILELIEDLNLDDREVAWGDLLGRPDAFPPAKHLHDVGDIYGFEYVVQMLNQIREAILTGDRASHDEIKAMIQDRFEQNQDFINDVLDQLNAHEARRDNPHGVTKAQTGLGNVDNFSTANTDEAKAGETDRRFMTPLKVKQAIEHIAITALNAHKSDKSNPHDVTKAQVELGNVDNFSTASSQEAIIGNNNQRFMTPLRVKEAIYEQVGKQLNTHEARRDNPHGVTKAQVALGQVENLPLATQTQAQDGTLHTRYMTPLRVKQAIEHIALTALNAHIADKSNPHNVTKAQVDLGNVDNYSRADYDARYANQNGTYLNLRARATTKGDVGLGQVEDLPLATQAQAQDGILHTRYMTPLRVKQAIEHIALTALNSHIADKSNPHGVTKAQVDLGNVDNYSRAHYDGRYANQNGTYAGLRARATTKGDVGLGSVQNYGIASRSQAESGSSNSLYMTPLRVRQAIEAFGGAGDEWIIFADDWGYAIHASSGFAIQWGASRPLSDAVPSGRCYFKTPFNGRPFTVVPGNLALSVDSAYATMGQMQGSVVNRSVTAVSFVANAGRFAGRGDDWVVVSWIAIGYVSAISHSSQRYASAGTTGPYAGSIRSTDIGGFSTSTPPPPTPPPWGGGGGGGCLSLDTEITLANGDTTQAKHIKVGDEVLSGYIPGMDDADLPHWRDWTTTEIEGREQRTSKVTNVTYDTFRESWVVNDVLRITQQHEIFARKAGVWGWRDVRDLEKGDLLINDQNKVIMIRSIVLDETPLDVVDFDVEEVDTYFAGGVLVHNVEQKELQ